MTRIHQMSWFALLLLLNCGDLSAQMFRYLDTGDNPRLAASGSMLYQPKTHVSGGGDITMSSYRITTGGLTPINERTSHLMEAIAR